MATNKDIVNAIKNIKIPTTDLSSVNQNINANTVAVEKLGEGIDIDFDVVSSELKDSIKSDLNGMGDFFKNIITELTSINNKLTRIEPVKDEKTEKDEKSEETTDIVEYNKIEDNNEIEDVEWEIVGVDSNIKDTTPLIGFNKPGSLIASGFSLLANVLDYTSEKILQSLPLLSQASKSEGSQSKNLDKTDQKNSEPLSKKFSNFLQDLIGPLQSVATATLTIATAIGILSLLPISGEALGSVAAIYGTLIGTFFILNALSKRYIEHQAIMDPKKSDQPGNLMGLINSITNMITKMALSFGLMLLTITILQPSVSQVLSSLGLIVGLTITSIVAANLLAKTIKPTDLTAQDGIFGLINAISNMVLKLSVGILIVSLLPIEMFWAGFARITALLTITELSIVGLNMLMKSSGTSAEDMQAFSSIIRSMQSLILTLGILVAVLGLMPPTVISQGMATITLLFALVDISVLALTKIMGGLAKQGEDQINQASKFITSLTITIGIMSLLVVVLGLIPTPIIIQGMATLTAIFGVVILATFLISKIKISPNVFATLGIVALLTVSIAGVALLITSMALDAQATMSAVLSLGIVAIGFVAIGTIGMLLGVMGSFLTGVFVPAMAALGIISLLVVSIAGVGFLVTKIISGVGADSVKESINTIIDVAVSLTKLTVPVLALGLLAIPLGLGVSLALISLAAVTSFVLGFNKELSTLSEVEIDTAPLTTLNSFTESLQIALTNILALSPVIMETALALPVLAITLGITNLSLVLTIRGLISISKSLNNLNNLQSSDVVNSNLANLVDNISSLANTVKLLEGFKGLTTTTTTNIKKTLKSINDISKSLAVPNNKSDISNIDGLANSLEKLASVEPGLARLAEAIKDVAKATQDINDLNIDVKQSVEVLSKKSDSFEDMKNSVQKANDSKKSGENTSQSETLNVLNGILSGISDLGKQVSSILASNQRLAVATEANSYSPSISDRS